MEPPPALQCSDGHPPALPSRGTFGATSSTSSAGTCPSTSPPAQGETKDSETSGKDTAASPTLTREDL